MGVSPRLCPGWTTVLAFSLDYLSGFGLAHWQKISRARSSFKAVMNYVDFIIGGVHKTSVWNIIVWFELGVAIVLGLCSLGLSVMYR